MIIDGRALAEKRIQELLTERETLGALTLSLVVMQEDAVTTSFLRIKSRVAERLGVAIEYVPTLDTARGDGIILQLPLPPGTDPDVERNHIPLMRDVDVLSDAAFDAFVYGTFPPPPVARGLETILQNHQVVVRGAKVVVVGQGRLVGKPAAELFRLRGAAVTALGKGDDIAPHTREADIVILGAGEPGLLTPDMVQEGVIILDAGASESAGKVVGDADPSCAEKAALYTPVPGGVGPVAVVEIFANLFELVRKR
jgi:methylenetetrahydrofolate dehydrogenase (NADP+)/methenyltetrahydrofolate cyclohydrolase